MLLMLGISPSSKATDVDKTVEPAADWQIAVIGGANPSMPLL